MKIRINRIRLLIASAIIVEIGLCILSNPYINLASFCVLGALFCGYGSKVIADPTDSEVRTLQRISRLFFGTKADEEEDFEEAEQ